jgi:DNA-binding MarR family transcriptional regulator
VKIDGGDDAEAATPALGHAEQQDEAWPCSGVASSAADAPTVVNADAESGRGATAPFTGVGFTLSSLGYAVARRFRETLAPLDLEPREFALLRAVRAHEGQTQQAVGERLMIPPSRMVAFVDALEQRALLERRHNPLDRRTRELYLTASGRELLARAFALGSELERALCASLSGEDREQLVTLLQRVGSELGVPPAVHAHAALADK